MLILQRNLRMTVFGFVFWCCTSTLVDADDLRIVKLVEPERGERRERLIVSAPCINERGDIAFCCNNREDQGVWLASKSGELRRICKSEELLSDTTDTAESVSGQLDVNVMNDAGQIAFQSWFRNEPNGIWSYDHERGVEIVARGGMVAPGVEPDVFASIPRRQQGGLLLGQSGKVVFFAEFADKVRPRGIAPFGFWEKTIGGELKLISKQMGELPAPPPEVSSNDHGDLVSGVVYLTQDSRSC
jgi:hypothetical protein